MDTPEQVLKMSYHALISSRIYIHAWKDWCGKVRAEKIRANFITFCLLESN